MFGRRRSGERERSFAQPAKRSTRSVSRSRRWLRSARRSGIYFAAQYQQRPAPAGGGMVKTAWFRRYRRDEPPAFDRIVQSWDTANKPSELSDYSGLHHLELKGQNFYLLDVVRRKLSYPELRRAVVEENSRFRPQAILIEDRRLHAQTAVIENGFVLLPDEAPWLADYLAELTTFPARAATRPGRFRPPRRSRGRGARSPGRRGGSSFGLDRPRVWGDFEDGEGEGAGRRLACPRDVRRSTCRSERSYPRVRTNPTPSRS